MNTKIILILIIACVFNTSTLAKQDLQKVSLQLNWKNQFQFAGYYMAKELGYYKDIGIDIDIREYKYGMNITSMIENKKVDFAIGRSSLLIDKANGKDIVALGAIFQNSPLVLLTIDKNINTFNDFKNKKIMITTDARETASITAMLNSNKINISNLQVQKHSFDLNDLLTGKTDIMASYISNEPIILDNKNIKYRVFDPKDSGFDFYSDILYTSSKFIDKNPKLTKAFFQATIKGWKYAFNNIGHTSNLIYKQYNTQNKSLSSLVSEGEALKKLAHHKNSDTIGCLDIGKLQKTVDIYKVIGLIKENIDLENFIYEHNPHASIRIDLSHQDIYILFLIILLIFISIIAILYYFSIKKRWLITQESLNNKLKELEFKDKQLYEQAKLVSMGEMIGNIAHQWRQPLSIIAMGANNIRADIELDTLDIDTLETILNDISNETLYMSKTIDDFKNFIKGDQKKELFNLTNNIESFIDLAKGTIVNNNINIVKNLQNNIELNNYPNQLIQCYMNIFNNAKDILKEKVRSNKLVFISTFIQNDRVIIKIKDNAGGIDDNNINKIFEPYFTTKHKSKGTGLGLHMTYNLIVDGMGGTVEASNVSYEYNSAEYIGAEFTISLPMK